MTEDRSRIGTATISPIGDDDIGRVAHFLHTNLSRRIPPDAWVRAMSAKWEPNPPNHGYFMTVDGVIVGAYVAYYSRRVSADGDVRICNLGPWCVVESQRFHSIRLLKALLAQDGYHFVDLSPSGNVVPVNLRMRFTMLDTATALVPNLPWPTWPRRASVTSDHATIEATLRDGDLAIYRDHVDAAAARHLVFRRGADYCYVIFRKDRRKRLPVFASILYVSDQEMFAAACRRIGRRMLLRHGVLATLAELRIVGGRPRPSIMLGSPRPKMFKSPTLTPERIDYLYSELVLLPW